jgi:hypothetical protein
MLLPLASAVRLARAELNPPATKSYPFLVGFHEKMPVSGQVGGFTIHVRTELDTEYTPHEPDVNGWFTDEFDDGCVPNTTPSMARFAWYHPTTATRADTLKALQRQGMSKAVAHQTYQHLMHREYTAHTHRSYVPLVVTVKLNDHLLASIGVWGTTSNPDNDTYRHLITLAAECVTEALRQARANLPAHIASLHEQLATATAHLPGRPPTGRSTATTQRNPLIMAIPGGEMQVFPPDPADRSPMLVFDVLGLTILTYVREDGSTYVHLDESDSWDTYSRPLLVEAFNGGENQYGPDPEDRDDHQDEDEFAEEQNLTPPYI